MESRYANWLCHRCPIHLQRSSGTCSCHEGTLFPCQRAFDKVGDHDLMAYIERGRSIFGRQVSRIGGEAEFSRTTEEGRVVIERLCKCVGGLEREPMAGLLFQRKHRAVVV